MQKKITHTAPITANGEQVGTYYSVKYVPMTRDEVNIRLALISLAVFAVMFIGAAISSL